MNKTIPEVKARQGRLGRPVLIVLIASLVLIGIVWAVVEFYGQAIEPAAQQTQSEQAN